MPQPDPQVTQILLEWADDPQEAANRLFPLVYAELRQIAAHYFRRERSSHTLQPTALVHEAFLRLVDQTRVQWQSRAHFMAVAASMMRRVLLDYARAHQAQRRGGDLQRVSLEDLDQVSGTAAADFLALDRALDELARLDPKQARVVELRFFGGMTIQEVAAVEDLSEPTIKRYWNSARAFLHRELTRGSDRDTGTLGTG